VLLSDYTYRDVVVSYRQMQLLREFWPLEILECDEGKEVHDEHGNLLARGLSVRMGVHCGTPMCESDPSLVTWIISGLW
jgi:hypothetical protein